MDIYQKAFILIKASPGHEREVVDDLMGIDEVKEAHIIPGAWDVMAVLDFQTDAGVPSDRRVYDLVQGRIAKISHMLDTSTMVSYYSRSNTAAPTS